MRLHNARQFGIYLMRKRKAAKIPLMHLAETLEIHPKVLGGIEGGMSESVDDDLLNELVEHVPGFSLAIAPGVQAPAVPVRELEGREGPRPKPVPAAQMTPATAPGPAQIPKPRPPRTVPTDDQLGSFVDSELRKG